MSAIFDTTPEGFSRTSVIAASSDMTAAGWFYSSGTPAGGTFRTFIYQGDDPVTSYVQYLWIGQKSDGTVEMDVTYNSGFPDFVQGFSPVLGVGWHYIAYVRSGTSHKLYIDGTLVISLTADASAQTFTHAYLFSDSFDTDWDPGRAAYYREWNAALTASELDTERYATTAQRTSNLWHEATFAANNQDSSGNGRHWTDIGTISYGAQPQWVTVSRSESITVAENFSSHTATALRQSVNDAVTVTEFADYYGRDVTTPLHGVQAHVTRIPGTSSTSATRYISVINGASWLSLQAAAEIRIPVHGFLRNLKIELGTSPGSARSRTYTVLLNGAVTPLEVVISGTNVAGQNTTAVLPVGVNDEVVLRMVPSGTPSADSGGTHIAVEFEGRDGAESMHTGDGSQPSVSTTNYAGIFEPGEWNSNNNLARSIIAVEGDVVSYTVDSSSAPTGTYNFYLYKNGVRQDGSGGTPNTNIPISSGSRSGSWAGSISASPDDFFSVQCVPSGSGGVPFFPIAVGFVADVEGESHFGGGGMGTGMSISAVEYWPPSAGIGSPSSTDTVEGIGTVTTFTLKALHVALSAAPGSGDSYTFDTRKNNADDTLQVAISGSGTGPASDTGDVTITQTDRWGFKTTPGGSPTAGIRASWSWKQYIVPGTAALSVDAADAVAVADSASYTTSPILRSVFEGATVTEFAYATNNAVGEGSELILVADAVTAQLFTVRLTKLVFDAVSVVEARTALLNTLRLNVSKFESVLVTEAKLRVFKTPHTTTRAEFIDARDVVRAQMYIGGGLGVRVHDLIDVNENPFFIGYAAGGSTGGTAAGVRTDGAGYLAGSTVIGLSPGQGTATGATTNSAGYAAGVGTVTLAAGGTGSFNVGDIILIAGDPTPHIVTEGDTDISNGGSISFTPGLGVTLPASPVVITVIGTTAPAGTGAFVPGDVIRFGGDPNPYIVTVGDPDISNGGSITIAGPGLVNAIPAGTNATVVKVGTVAGAATNNTGYPAGSNTITLTPGGVGALVPGDVVMFPNDPTRYTVTEGDPDISNGGTISISPGIVVAIPATSTTITKVGTNPAFPNTGSVGAGPNPGVPEPAADGSDYWINGV